MSRRDLARALLPWGLVVVATSALLRVGDWRTKVGAGVEAAIYLALLSSFLARSSVRAGLGVLPSPHRVVLAGVFTALLIGHFARDARATFPFPGWTMYGTPGVPGYARVLPVRRNRRGAGPDHD